MKKVLIFSVLFIISISVYNQSTELSIPFHKVDKDELETYCWKSNNKEKSDTAVNEKWRKESAVVLYSETLINAIIIGFNKPILVPAYLVHKRIKIQDNAALEKFSTINFDELGNNPDMDGLFRSLIRGLKLVKRNGTELIIDIKNDEDEAAVSGLEKGDIVDYYSLLVKTYPTQYYGLSYLLYDIRLISKYYPVQIFKYGVITDRNWKVSLNTGNEFDIIESKVGNKDNYYKFQIFANNISPMHSELWSFPFRSFSYVKFQLDFSNKYQKETGEMRDTLCITKISNSQILLSYSSLYNKSKSASNEFSDFMSYLKRIGKENVSKEVKLEEYYYFLRHHFVNKHFLYDNFNISNVPYSYHNYGNGFDFRNGGRYRGVSNSIFTSHLIYGLHKFDIPYEILVSVNRELYNMDNVFSAAETDFVIRARLNNKTISMYKPSPYTRFNDFPFLLEGTDGFVIIEREDNKRELKAENISIPSSDANDNKSSFTTNISLKEGFEGKISANTNVILTGYSMVPYKKPLTDWVEMIWNENDKYGTKKWGDLEKSDKKFKIQMDEFISDREKDRKKNFEDYAKSHFDLEELTLKTYNCENTGNGPGEYDFKFNFDCELEGLIKKVGPNYILKIGKLVSGQVILDEEDLDRDIDVYMNYARTFSYTVNIEIPEGYEVKGLNNLFVDVENKTGFTKSEATLNGNIIILKFTKQYKNNFEKAEDWPLMKEFLIPASLIPSKEIIFKKI